MPRKFLSKQHRNTYETWTGMKMRCGLRKPQYFARYRDRGITVCERWANSYAAFEADMGLKPPGLSLDRINNDGNYEPGNCRWATNKQQSHNSTNPVFITHNGETLCVREWERRLGLGKSVIAQRLLHGDSTPERIFRPKDINGVFSMGSKCATSKLKEDDVMHILKCDDSAGVLSEKYGVSQSAIYHIRARRNWRHVQP